MVLSFHFMQIVIENIIDFDIDSFWYYNWNCSQFEQNQNFIFLLFCWINIGDILNFKSARLNLNSLPFYKNAFYIEIASKRIFSVNGGQARPRLRGPSGPAPPSTQKIRFEAISM